MLYLLIVMLIVHVVMSVVVFVLFSLGKMRLRPAALPFVFLCVIFGPFSALFFQTYKLRHGDSADIEVPKFKIESEIYRSLGFEVEDEEEVVPLEDALVLNDSATRRSLMLDLVKDSVVPLEEALAISSSDVRRKLMMDVLNTDTVAFYDLLEQARLNDDTEVVHYATTAMSELSKKYDMLLAELEEKHNENPDDLEILDEYCSNLRQYLNLGMASGQILAVNRGKFIGLLAKLCQKQPTLENFSDFATQLMKAGVYGDADVVIREMESRWPDDENVWYLRLEYHVRRGDGKAVHETVDRALREHIYFSSKTRGHLTFWLGSEADRLRQRESEEEDNPEE